MDLKEDEPKGPKQAIEVREILSSKKKGHLSSRNNKKKTDCGTKLQSKQRGNLNKKRKWVFFHFCFFFISKLSESKKDITMNQGKTKLQGTLKEFRIGSLSNQRHDKKNKKTKFKFSVKNTFFL